MSVSVNSDVLLPIHAVRSAQVTGLVVATTAEVTLVCALMTQI